MFFWHSEGNIECVCVYSQKQAHTRHTCPKAHDTLSPEAEVRTNVEKTGSWYLVFRGQLSTVTPIGRQNTGTDSGRGKASRSSSGYRLMRPENTYHLNIENIWLEYSILTWLLCFQSQEQSNALSTVTCIFSPPFSLNDLYFTKYYITTNYMTMQKSTLWIIMNIADTETLICHEGDAKTSPVIKHRFPSVLVGAMETHSLNNADLARILVWSTSTVTQFTAGQILFFTLRFDASGASSWHKRIAHTYKIVVFSAYFACQHRYT